MGLAPRQSASLLLAISPYVFILQHIFDKIALADNVQYLVRASYLEIYNEEIRDLLSKVRPCTAFYCVVREPFSIAGISSPCLVNQLLQPPTKVCRRRR